MESRRRVKYPLPFIITGEQMKDRDQEIQEARKALKEDGAYKFFVEPMIDEWKAHPFKSIGIFLMWAFIMYTSISAAQAVYFDTIYCDSVDDAYDGKMMQVYNEYVAYANEYFEEERTKQASLFGQYDYSGMEKEEFRIECGHDVKRWIHESPRKNMEDVLGNLQKILLKRS